LEALIVGGFTDPLTIVREPQPSSRDTLERVEGVCSSGSLFKDSFELLVALMRLCRCARIGQFFYTLLTKTCADAVLGQSTDKGCCSLELAANKFAVVCSGKRHKGSHKKKKMTQGWVVNGESPR
jgi:hypothetical protein